MPSKPQIHPHRKMLTGIQILKVRINSTFFILNKKNSLSIEDEFRRSLLNVAYYHEVNIKFKNHFWKPLLWFIFKCLYLTFWYNSRWHRQTQANHNYSLKVLVEQQSFIQTNIKTNKKHGIIITPCFMYKHTEP